MAVRRESFNGGSKETTLAATLLPPERYQYNPLPVFFGGTERGSTSCQPASVLPADQFPASLHASVSTVAILQYYKSNFRFRKATHVHRVINH